MKAKAAKDMTLVERLSKGIDVASEFFAHRKGLLPGIGIILIVFNFVLTLFLPADSFLVRTNLFLHLGLLVAIIGQMLAWVL